jgi:hypothetical protein
MKFVNRIAQRVGEENPGVLIQTLAYNMLIDAPTKVKPAANVMVGFAPITRVPSPEKMERAGYWYPLYDPRHEINRVHLEQIEKWLQVLDPRRFFTYEYYSHWTSSLAMIGRDTTADDLEKKLMDPGLKRIHVYSDAMAKDIWYYTQIGMKGIGTEEWDWDEVNMYIYPRLTWEPDLAPTALVADYCTRAYGAAAAPMTRHWLILQEAKENYPFERVRCLALLEEAKKMTRDSSILRRIEELRGIWSRLP